MRALKMTGMLSLLLYYCANAEGNTFSSFSCGFAIPVTSTSVMTKTTEKKAGTGWEGSWTFLGKPFANAENLLSGLALGGKISYSYWVRDSTYTAITFLGTQGIARFYTPPIIKPFDLFGQLGGGMFIGEYGFSDPDTLVSSKPIGQTIEGKKNLGISLGIGVNWDVFEILPIFTMVLTKENTSAWLSINAGMKF